jgi:hypothetical protein
MVKALLCPAKILQAGNYSNQSISDDGSRDSSRRFKKPSEMIPKNAQN